MTQAWETFNDAYLKKLKRPEFWGFNPDQASGSSMLFRSEETNPWAGRDKANAQYGPMGAGGMGASNISVNQAPQSSVMNLVPEGLNLPMMPSPQKDTFNQLMSPVAGVGSKVASDWMSKKVTDWLSGPQSFDKLSPEMQGFAEQFTKGGPVDAYGELASRFGKESLAGTESGLGGYEKLAEGMTGKASETTGDLMAGFDPTSAVMTAAPMLAKMFGLKGTASDALSAAGSTGAAALQGFMNPINDVGALLSIVKFFRGLF